MLGRREFLSASAAAFVTSRLCVGQNLASRASERHFCCFSKPFNSVAFPELAKKTAELGFHGIEAPIRKGGHIDPSRVEKRLPELVDALKKQGCRLSILASDINDVDDPVNQRVLKTAAGLGISFYRLKYFKYDQRRTPSAQIAEIRARLKDLAQLNSELGIVGLYQNHAGRDYFGAGLWDLARAVENIDPRHLAVAFDIRHAVAEASTSWATAFRQLKPHVRSIYVKDFDWREQKPVEVPLGEGMVKEEFFDLLVDPGFDGPINLHVEYTRFTPNMVDTNWRAFGKDLAVLRSWIG